MKKFFTVLYLVISFTVWGENKTSIEVENDKVIAKITLEKEEYITLNDMFLYLTVESEHYDFTFNGYPDGVLQDSGDIYYSKELVLEGSLTLKDGVAPGEYSVNVILAYQTCTKEGLCNIPIEVSEEIIVQDKAPASRIPYILGSIAVLFALAYFVLWGRKRS